MKKIFLMLFVIVGILNAQQVIDKIVAVVDNEITLQSELDFRINMEAAQKNLNPADVNLQRKILNSMMYVLNFVIPLALKFLENILISIQTRNSFE